MIKQYNFHKNKYDDELLIDLIPLENLRTYISRTPVHRLSYFDITIITDGQGSFCIDQQIQPVKSGSVFFTLPGQVRRWKAAEIPSGYALIFEEEFLCSFFNDPYFVQNLSYFSSSSIRFSIVLPPDEFRQIISILRGILTEIRQQETKDKHMLRALLYQILMLLNRIYLSQYPTTQSQLASRHVQKFIGLVHVNYLQSRSVDFYAKQLNITPGHLNDLVKYDFGYGAKYYIINRTMQEAKRLLSYTELSVDEIARCLHFDTTSYFVRAFHKNTGQTPLSFRKSHIREK